MIEVASLPLGQRYGLEGACVVVTGATGSIGRALASAFQAQGARLVITDRDAWALHDFAQRLTPFGSVEALACDLNDDDAIAAFAAQLKLSHGVVDVLVNSTDSAGPTQPNEAAPDALARNAPLPRHDVDRMARLTRALLPLMAHGASIINQSSVWGQSGAADGSQYVAPRNAVIELTNKLARELAPRGIRVNAVCPGWIRTEAALRSLQGMAAQQGRTEAEIEREILSRQALPGMLKPADIVGVYLFLASTDARSLTGQSLAASNGAVMN